MRHNALRLMNLRTRTGALLTATSISTAFLGAVAAQQSHGLPAKYWLALGPFGVSVLLSLYVLLPGRNWVFQLKSSEFDSFGTRGIDEVQRGLAILLEEKRTTNESRITTRAYLFGAAALLLAISIGFWIYLIEVPKAL